MKRFFKYLVFSFLSLNILTYFNTKCMYDDSPCTCATNGCSACAACDQANCCTLGQCDGYPFLLARSVGRNYARELVGWQQFINRYDMDSTYGAFSVTAEYGQSFRPNHIANFLFGSDLVDCKNLYIQGSQVTDRKSNAWLADYFGLPSDFESRVSFCPKIQNFIIDPNFYIGLDELASGLFFRFQFPLAWTKWQLCPCEQVLNKGDNNIGAGYMSTTTIYRDDLANSFLQAMDGKYVFGDMQSPIKAGKFINNCNTTKTTIAQINLQLGWNFVNAENYHFGLGFYAAVPTGTTPSATYLFEPIVGNGKHWELGAALTGSWIFHRSESNPDRYVGIWYDALAAHLFNSCQCRSFDLCGKPNSRYILLEQMGTNNDTIKGEINDNETTASYQYNRNLVPAINWSTFSVDVRIDVMADAVIKLGCVMDNWTFDLGYNFWARSGEKFCNNRCVNDNTKIYAIKGDSWIYGAIDNGTGNIYPMSTSEFPANIHSGTNYPSQNGDNPATNPRVDHATFAFQDTNELYTVGAANQIKTSINPIIISKTNLNLGKSPSSITNKGFMHIGYAWKEKEGDYVPFLGFGCEVELATDNYDKCCCCSNSCCKNNSKLNSLQENFDNSNDLNSLEKSNTTNSECKNKGCCNSSSSTCCNCSCDACSVRGGVSNWGAWVKGGIAFD